jgi:hypothetical protein
LQQSKPEIEDDDDEDEWPRKPGFFLDATCTPSLIKRKSFEKSEFLQLPHSQRDPPSVHGEDEERKEAIGQEGSALPQHAQAFLTGANAVDRGEAFGGLPLASPNRPRRRRSRSVGDRWRISMMAEG